MSKLFRDAAIEAKRAQWYGAIVMSNPWPLRLTVAVTAAIAVLLIAFLAFGSYTKRVTVSGQLVPDKGLIKVYAQQAATVMEEQAAEGAHVAANQVLFA